MNEHLYIGAESGGERLYETTWIPVDLNPLWNGV
jgi:hypothetical protein